MKAVEFQLEKIPDLSVVSGKIARGMRAAMVAWANNFWATLVRERLSGSPYLNRRTGNLARDWVVDATDGEQMQVEIRTQGTANAYAGIHETGGTIRPKNAKYLWIPLKPNQTAAGVARLSPRQAINQGGFIDWRGPIFYGTKGTTSTGGAKKLVPLFALKKEVYVPPRMGASSLFNSKLPQLERLLAMEAQGAWQ